MNKRKLIAGVLILLVAVAGSAYKFAVPHKVVKERINGTIYVLPKEFTINLAGGQYATVTVALLLAPTQSVGVTSASNPPPTGFGSLTEEAVIRAIITNVLTGQQANTLISASGRQQLTTTILRDIKQQTDTLVTNVYFTDLAVQ